MAAVTPASTTSVQPFAWEESTGLISSLVPQSGGSTAGAANKTVSDAAAFNASKGELKLGPVPLDDGLRAEADRLLIRDMTPQEIFTLRTTAAAGVTSPSVSDLPPHPPLFRTIDIKREVEKVRDARKRIRLEPSTLALEKDSSGTLVAAARARALPSICAYTLHDVGDGWVSLVIQIYSIS